MVRIGKWKKDKWTKSRWFVPNKRSISVRGVFGSSPYHIMTSKVMKGGTTKTGRGSRTIKVLKTKEKAVKFARNYMKRHPKG